MRRLWLGLGILTVLLILSLGVGIAMDKLHSPISQQLEQAALAADREDWQTAAVLAQSAKSRWENVWFFTSTVADHTPMDELDALFGELEVYLQEQETPHFSVTAKHLSQLAQAMAGSHQLNVWNIF